MKFKRSSIEINKHNKHNIEQIRVRHSDLVEYRKTCGLREDEFINRLIKLHKILIHNYESGRETTFIEMG